MTEDLFSGQSPHVTHDQLLSVGGWTLGPYVKFVNRLWCERVPVSTNTGSLRGYLSRGMGVWGRPPVGRVTGGGSVTDGDEVVGDEFLSQGVYLSASCANPRLNLS